MNCSLYARCVCAVLLSVLAGLTSCGWSSESPVMRVPAVASEKESGRAAHEPVPTAQLPSDVRPLRYELSLRVDPAVERFGGHAVLHVELARRTSAIWLHGQGLTVSAVSAHETPEGAPVAGKWRQVDDALGVARVGFEAPLGPGPVVVDIEYTAAFGRQLMGLYRIEEGGRWYAFTQFEAIAARQAFPCIDEPAQKVPFDVELIVRDDHVAVANTRLVREEKRADGFRALRYARTPPLPPYLVAWAIGPLDVQEAPAIDVDSAVPCSSHSGRSCEIPFRGFAASGKGSDLTYGLAQTPRIVAALQRYFSRPYPYDKLDVVAVPDFAPGAMENAGLITFREPLLLLDEASPEWQRRAFAYVMAHELAHQWFGNLVTMRWWDDLWLNEAFATWMGHKIVDEVYPHYDAGMAMLEAVHDAMKDDSLVSARQIRQPVETTHDISNAFDSITYEKGGGVLAMFERWLGEEVFQRGIQRYLANHAWASATATDLLDALSEEAGRDVATPFRTFLTQPGLPFLYASLECSARQARLALRQSRYLPVGSKGSEAMSWQIPVCVRYGRGKTTEERCELMVQSEQSITLDDGCPEWVVPNAGGAGYVQFGMDRASFARLMQKGWTALTSRERFAVASALRASFANAAMPAADVLGMLGPIAHEPSPSVVGVALDLLGFVRSRMAPDVTPESVRRYGRRLLWPTYRRLGWKAAAQEPGERRLLRADLVRFFALVLEDEAVRTEAARRGRACVGFRADGQLHPESVDPDLAPVVLAVSVQEGDEDFFEAVVSHLDRTADATLRQRLLRALGHATDPALAARALGLALDPRLRSNEVLEPLWAQISVPERREPAWAWIQAHFDELVARLSPRRAGSLPWMAVRFCTEERAREVERFFGSRIARLEGGPRNLRATIEAIELCAARVAAQKDSARSFFETP